MSGIIGKPGLKTGFKVLIVVVLLLLLLIPLGMIKSLVFERQERARQTTAEIVRGAGGTLQMVGPILLLPYIEDVEEYRDGTRIVKKKRGTVCMLPEEISIEGRLDVEYRYRGIYRVPVYSAHLAAEGILESPGLDVYPEGAVPLAEENRLVVGIADMRGIREVSLLEWNGSGRDFLPSEGHVSVGSGIESTIGALPAAGTPVMFGWTMEIGGGGSVSVAPLARNSELLLEGNWPSPSFGGAVLPDEREWNEEGFSARWRIPEVSRPVRGHWISQGEVDPRLRSYSLEVELLEPVSAYARTERSVKHGALFLIIPFVVFFLFEMLGGARIHPVQYLLAGAADVVFYLLLLAISEHLSFDGAYLVAAAGVTLLISLYSRSVAHRWPPAFAMAGVLAAAYLWLWITLKSEDYALLIGSIGLFVVVGAVMFLTRKTDWYGGRILADGADLGSEGEDGESGELDVLDGEGNPDNGDGEQKGGDQVADGEFPPEE